MSIGRLYRLRVVAASILRPSGGGGEERRRTFARPAFPLLWVRAKAWRFSVALIEPALGLRVIAGRGSRRKEDRVRHLIWMMSGPFLPSGEWG